MDFRNREKGTGLMENERRHQKVPDCVQNSEVRLEEGASIYQDRSVVTLSVESLPWLVQVLRAELKDRNIDHQ